MKELKQKKMSVYFFFCLLGLQLLLFAFVSLFPTPLKLLPFINAAESSSMINFGISPTSPLSLDNKPKPNVPKFANPLFIGDSLTAGRGASLYEHSFPLDTLHMLNARELESADIIGRSGYTVGYINNILDIPKNAFNADLIVLELGTNDILDKDTGMDKVQHLVSFQQQYRLLVNNLRITAPHAALVCLSLWWSNDRITPSGLSMNQLNQIIENQCNAFNGIYIDISDIYSDPYNHTEGDDWFHPNDRGHEKIAQLIFNTLSAL